VANAVHAKQGAYFFADLAHGQHRSPWFFRRWPTGFLFCRKALSKGGIKDVIKDFVDIAKREDEYGGYTKELGQHVLYWRRWGLLRLS